MSNNQNEWSRVNNNIKDLKIFWIINFIGVYINNIRLIKLNIRMNLQEFYMKIAILRLVINLTRKKNPHL